jgi:AcrR family transcriptional regulator
MEAEETPRESQPRGSRPGGRRDLREDILEAATRLFAEQGYPKTSIRQVVEACGCTKPALYYYFANKEELFAEAVRVERNAMLEMLADLVQSKLPLKETIFAATERFVEHAEANRTKIQLLRRVDLHIDEQSPEVERESAGAREMHMNFLTELFSLGISRGEIRPDVEPRDCAIALAGTIDLQLQLWLQGEPWSAAVVGRTINLLFDGIAQR